MKPGDIVRTTCNLTPLNDEHIPSGMRLRLTHVHLNTESGRRWAGVSFDGRKHYNIPEDALEVIA